jgi:hypothetical protein
MCPAAERQKRLNESDIHKLEIPHPLMTPGRLDYADTMVKKFQRSSADHALQIPHLLRTPEALLRSIGTSAACIYLCCTAVSDCISAKHVCLQRAPSYLFVPGVHHPPACFANPLCN